MSAIPPFVLLRVGDKIAGTAKPFTGASDQWCRTLHGSPLCKFAKSNQDLVVIYSVQVFSEFHDVLYPYGYGGPEPPPKRLGDLNQLERHFKSFIAWDNVDLVPHVHGCDLKETPVTVSARNFLQTEELRTGSKSQVFFRKGDGDDSSDARNYARDVLEPSLGESGGNAVEEPSNDANDIIESRNDDHQETAISPEIADSDSQKEWALNSLRKGRFSRLRRTRTASNTPLSIQSGAESCRAEPVMSLDVEHDSINCMEVESENIRAADSLGASAAGDIHLSPHCPSLDDESDGAEGTARQANERSQNESDLEDQDESSSDSTVHPESCLHTIPFPKKRAYVYHRRKRRIPEGPRDLRKRRKLLSQRMDNPFLRSGLRCCKSNRCYENIDPTYAFKTYKDLMALNREDFKSYLISIYDSQEHFFKMLGRKVCARYLQRGFGFSNDLQCSVKNTPNARAGPNSLALPRAVRRTTKKDLIITFLRNYADECGDMMPNALFTNLPDAGRLDVYEKFKTQFKQNHPSETPPVLSFFYAVWKAHCTGIRTRRNHGFARCENCVLLKAEIAENRGRGSIVRQATKSLREHLDFVMEERRMYHNRCERAIRYPTKYTSMVVDGADQKAYGLPHFLDKSKADRGHKFKVKCIGCLEHRSSKKLWIHTMTEEFLTGANHIIEVIHRALTARKSETGRLTEVLYLQVDNCTRENKNRYLFGYLELLVALGVFMEVEVSFLPVGHTHTDIDQAFSVVSRILSRTDAATMTELINAIDSCYLGKASALRLEKVANFSGLCEQAKCLVSTQSVGGIMHLRYFRFTRATGDMLDDGVFKTQCHVKVQFVDDWQPLSMSTTKGFLKRIPNLLETPPTETIPPDNVVEINKCLESVHSHSRKLAARVLPELEALREVVYTKREDPFHWDLRNCVELNGNFATDGDQIDSESDEEETIDDDVTPEYEPESFVAVKPPEGTKSRFWIAMVLKVVDRSSANRPRWLQVQWYSQKSGGRDEFGAKYVPSRVYDSRRKRHVPYQEQIEVETILLYFQSLNSLGHLRANTSSALRQVLGLS